MPDVRAMHLAQSCRQQHFQRLAQHLRSRPLKDFFRRLIEQQHALLLIHGNDRVHRRFQDCAYLHLGAAQGAPGDDFVMDKYRRRRQDRDAGDQDGNQHLLRIPAKPLGQRGEQQGGGRQHQHRAEEYEQQAAILLRAGLRFLKWRHEAPPPRRVP